MAAVVGVLIVIAIIGVVIYSQAKVTFSRRYPRTPESEKTRPPSPKDTGS